VPNHDTLNLIEFSQGTLRYVDAEAMAPATGHFHWLMVSRDAPANEWAALQAAAQQAGGTALLDLHLKDLRNEAHPTHYDYTSIYDVVIFRRLNGAPAPDINGPAHTAMTAAGSAAATSGPVPAAQRTRPPPAFRKLDTQAIGFIIFDSLLISVHPPVCPIRRSFMERYLNDVLISEAAGTPGRSRLPTSAADLMLRMINQMVDGYLDMRRQLATQLDHWQHELLDPHSRFASWTALMAARSTLQTLEDLCDEQHDAMLEWLDNLRTQPLDPMGQAERDNLIARCRDVIEHIERVVHHVRRLEQGAETAVQIHFSAQSHRTNDIMRTLTTLTAVFLPLNLVTGFFGMNFEFLPLIHSANGLWWAIASMVALALGLAVFFWRQRFISRNGGKG
jgi:Mg2+ and Co2+ transporter CorA